MKLTDSLRLVLRIDGTLFQHSLHAFMAWCLCTDIFFIAFCNFLMHKVRAVLDILYFFFFGVCHSSSLHYIVSLLIAPVQTNGEGYLCVSLSELANTAYGGCILSNQFFCISVYGVPLSHKSKTFYFSFFRVLAG
jgi:hypothetical protein